MTTSSRPAPPIKATKLGMRPFSNSRYATHAKVLPHNAHVLSRVFWEHRRVDTSLRSLHDTCLALANCSTAGSTRQIAAQIFSCGQVKKATWARPRRAPRHTLTSHYADNIYISMSTRALVSIKGISAVQVCIHKFLSLWPPGRRHRSTRPPSARSLLAGHHAKRSCSRATCRKLRRWRRYSS